MIIAIWKPAVDDMLKAREPDLGKCAIGIDKSQIRRIIAQAELTPDDFHIFEVPNPNELKGKKK